MDPGKDSNSEASNENNSAIIHAFDKFNFRARLLSLRGALPIILIYKNN
jgi:hypothetical protein